MRTHGMQPPSECTAYDDHKKHTEIVPDRDDGNARRQFVPTNCACSPGLGSPREGAVITSVLIGPNHKNKHHRKDLST